MPSQLRCLAKQPNPNQCSFLSRDYANAPFYRIFDGINKFIEMDIPTIYETLNHPASFSLKEYTTPQRHFDPKKDTLFASIPTTKQPKRQRSQGKFQIVTKPKVSYFQELSRPSKDFPSPQKYKTEQKLGRKYRSQQLLKMDPSAKKHTYIENIENYERKSKFPGVGKYEILKISDFNEKRGPSLKRNLKEAKKESNLDNVIRLASEVPGPGQFNPHFPTKAVKVNEKDHKFFIAKHANDQKKLEQSLSTNMGPNTYRPIPSAYETFAHIASETEKKPSRWEHEVEIRKGTHSQMKSPSPAEYNVVNQWGRLSGKDKQLGAYKLLDKVTLLRSKSVYYG